MKSKNVLILDLKYYDLIYILDFSRRFYRNINIYFEARSWESNGLLAHRREIDTDSELKYLQHTPND